MKKLSALLLVALVASCSHPAPQPTPAPVTPPPATNPTAGRGAPPQNPPGPTNPGPTNPGNPTTPGDTTNRPPGGNPGGLPGGLPPAAGGDPVPRPYAVVLRGDDKIRAGMFKTHRIGSTLYFEIPRAMLGKDMILTTEIEKTTVGAGYGGQPVGTEIIRWERRDNRILLRSVSYDISASDSTNPISIAVENANYAPIVRAFPVEAWSPGDSSAVINVTTMFTTQIPAEISLARAGRGTADPTRTFLNSVAAFKENIEIRSDVTTAGGGAPPNPLLLALGAGGAPNPSSTFLVHWSMYKLPDKPMAPRLFDSRVGFFSERTVDFSRPDQKAASRTFVTRYRLECSDAPKVNNLCVPKKPITYYVDPATPTWLVPWVKRAIESWQPAFEAAGFYKGIVAKDAPSKEEDPDWSPEDARYSVVDWLPSSVENAQGPHLSDPRSGEIFSAHLQIYHNVMNLNRNWYFVQAGAIDPRARKLPLPDSLAGRMMQFVIAHELGHSIGFQHNFKSSAEYPADSVRSASFVHRMGHTPSIMDYSRFNYVAQPEDKIALADIVPDVGPYDKWAVHWAYAPIPGAKSPDDERKTLDEWAREQDAKPWLRFSTSNSNATDPGEQTEAVGDQDAVKSTGYGIKNLKRIVPMIASATWSATDDNSDLREIYLAAWTQWQTELRHVIPIVGGIESQEKYGNQPGAKFTPESEARQRGAVDFLNEQAFQTPTWFLDQSILSRIEPIGTMARVTNAQSGILSTLLLDSRVGRLLEVEATAKPGANVYTAAELFADVRKGIFSELATGSVKIDPFRRALQSAYIDLMKTKIDPTPPGAPPGLVIRVNQDIRALARMELKTLDAMVQGAEGKAGDAITRAHLVDMHLEIDEVLNPKK